MAQSRKKSSNRPKNTDSGRKKPKQDQYHGRVNGQLLEGELIDADLSAVDRYAFHDSNRNR